MQDQGGIRPRRCPCRQRLRCIHTPVPHGPSSVIIGHRDLTERKDLRGFPPRKGVPPDDPREPGHVPSNPTAASSRPATAAVTDDDVWHALTALEALMGETQPALVTELLDRKERIRVQRTHRRRNLGPRHCAGRARDPGGSPYKGG